MSPDGKYIAAVTYDDRGLYLRDNRQNIWRKYASLAFLEELAWSRNSAWLQFEERARQGAARTLYRVSTQCEEPRGVMSIEQYSLVGSG